MTPPPAIPAATLILFREGGGAAPELLLIQRAAGMAFAAGALVFPGGRVDPGDRALAAALGGEAMLAGRIAAIRETIEEAGVAVGLLPAAAANVIADLRKGLAEGADFGALLAGAGLTIDPASLTPFARWRPDIAVTRSFDTLFFVAEAPADAVATADGSESVRAFWTTAQGALADADAGRHRIIFPTRRTLERLAALGSLAAAVEEAGRLPLDAITPWIEERGGESWLCIPEDRGYPITSERLSEARRG